VWTENSPFAEGQKGYAVNESIAPTTVTSEARSLLDEIVHQGAQRMLTVALQWEIEEFLERHGEIVDKRGNRLVVRNGYLPERTIQTGAGELRVRQGRVRDRRGAKDPETVRFTSSILPPYLKKSKSIEELIPWLYLRGISTGDFQEALQALLGEGAKGLSATTINRLVKIWEEEYQVWSRRSLEGKEYVYIWADGVYFNIRLEEDRQCILVLMGATADGKKELIGVWDGYRESTQSWRELLLDVKMRGLDLAPKLATADRAMGFWAALREVYPKTREQLCWLHKTARVLNRLPKGVQAKAKSDLHEIWEAETKKEAEDAFDRFEAKYGAKYEKAVETLTKDREELLTFYDFPAEHWVHLRTTNPIESTFGTVRHRHRKTKGSGSRKACLTMVFKLVQAAEKNWRRLTAPKLAGMVLEGYVFEDGIMQERVAA
jgi:putative transposase